MTWLQINAFDPVTASYKLLWTTPPPGQANMANSLPVTIASDQTVIPVSDANNAAFGTVTVITSPNSFGVCRSIAFDMSTTGSATLTFASAPSNPITFALSPGWNQYPFTGCTLTNFSGTGTAYALN